LLFLPDASRAILGYSIYRHGVPAAAQVYDCAIAIAHRILHELCGPGWKALRVQFSHGRPEGIAPYRRAFRSSVTFDADLSGVVFATTWLKRPIEGADPALHGFLERAIREAEAKGPMSFADQVQGMLHQMVLGGSASAEAVARLFAIHERTLRRRLAEEGTNLQQLINQARFELAQQLLGNTGLSVSKIATALQYGDPNAFSRAFRGWAQLSPTQWRARQ
jgi:AraC-like DNA-binding protein